MTTDYITPNIDKEIANAGGWEEYFQKRGNGTMQMYWTNRRFELMVQRQTEKAKLN